MSTLPLGYGGPEWYSSNHMNSYPFDTRLVGDVHKLFVDAYVVHNKNTDKKQRVRMTLFNPGTGQLQLRFEDTTILANFTYADNFQSVFFGEYIIYRWWHATTLPSGLTDDDIYVCLVVPQDELMNFMYPLTPSDAYIMASLINPRMGRVRRIAVDSNPGYAITPSDFVTSDSVTLEAGNNIATSVQAANPAVGLDIVPEDTVRVPTVVVIDADPGAGTGRYSTCNTTTPPLKLINTTGPDVLGNFEFQGQDCTWIERMLTGSPVLPPTHQNTDYLTTALDFSIELHQDCLACCDCSDYGDVYSNLSKIWTRARTAAARIEVARKQYIALNAQLRQIKIDTETGLNAIVRTLVRPDFHLAVGGQIYNNSKDDLGSVTIVFELDQPFALYTAKSGFVDAENMHQVQVDPIIVGLTYTVILPKLSSRAFARYTFEVRFAEGLTDRQKALVNVTLTATSGAHTASDVLSSQLQGPLVKT